MKATAGELLRRGIVPDLAAGRALRQQIADEVTEVLVGSSDVGALMQEGRELAAATSAAAVSRVASLLTGLVCSLRSIWGLFRHYWVPFKLAVNVVATIVLLPYMQTLDSLADVATATTLSSRELEGLRSPSPMLHAAAALLLLLVATTLAIYKPRGMTRYGQRKQHRQRALLVP